MTTLRKEIDQSVAAAVDRAVQSGEYRRYLGSESERLEHDLRIIFPAYHCLFVNSGTVALELALRSIGVVEGDQVILSGYDYPGNFWVVEQAKCTPVLVDVKPDSTLVDLEQLERARSDRTRALIVSHLHGQHQQIPTLRNWCDEYGIILIEDACQSIGARLEGQPLGSFGHLGLLSFGGSKVLSAGRGGALITADDRLFHKAKIAAGAGSGAYALSELAAAVVRAQLQFLPRVNQTTSDFFNAVERALPHSIHRVFLGDEGLTERVEYQAAYYQAGWILQTEKAVQAVVDRLSIQGLTVGTGFPGFHRRSARRCRTVTELTNTAALVDRLLVIHFSAAIEQNIEPECLANEMAEALKCCR